MNACETLTTTLAAQFAQRPNAPALVFGERTTSFGELGETVDAVARALVRDGVRHGDRVAYLGKNSDRYFALLFGALKAGAIMVPVNWRLARTEIEFVLTDSGASLLFVGPEFEGLAAQFADGVASIRKIVAVERSELLLIEFQNWIEPGLHNVTLPPTELRDVALIMYTSGTTGSPKGVMLTHANLLRTREGMTPIEDPEWFSWHAHETALIAMPTFHIGGTGQGLRALRNGTCAIITREFNVDVVLELIIRHRVSKVFLVPSAMRAIVEHPRTAETNFDFLEYILYGASPISPDLLRDCIQAFGCQFVHMYGMTESAGTIVALPPADHDVNDARRLSATGKPLPGVELKIVDGDGVDLPPNKPGEILIRSAATMLGYWQNEAATSAVLSAEGWLHTGDVGYLDDAGYLYMQDRLKDMIISGGENVYPAEVERVITGHPDVSDVAVIGIPSRRWGEEVKAIVALKPDAVLSADELIAWTRSRLAAYKTPKSIEFVASLPRNASGKLLKRDLRARYWPSKGRSIG